MIRGLRRIKRKDPRTLSFHRTFGTASLDVIPQEFCFDQTGVFPDQMEAGLPNACVAFATTGMASNNDKANYDDKNFTYLKTKQMMGVEGDVPTDQMTGLKSATVWGVRSKGQGDADALGHRQAPYYYVSKLGDKWQAVISAMWVKQGTLSIGTYWPSEAEMVSSDGIVPSFTVPSNWNVGHNWEACGVKLINGTQYIICKSWQGPNFGDKGYIYFNKQQINDLLNASGSGAFGQKHLEPGQEIQTVKFEIMTTLLFYLQELLAKLQGYFQ